MFSENLKEINKAVNVLCMSEEQGGFSLHYGRQQKHKEDKSVTSKVEVYGQRI